MVESEATKPAAENIEQEEEDQGDKLLNGKTADNALLDNIKRKGANSYYYAHAPRDYNTEGVKHLEEQKGLVYGGPPKLVATKSADEKPANII